MRILDRLALNAGPWLAAKMIRLFHRRLQPDMIGLEPVEKIWEQGENVILSFWHDQLFMMAAGYTGPRASVMISASKDGELIARTMGYFEIGTIRGSSTRGGRAAFKAMVDLGKAPLDLAFTPDGPKGPRHVIKDGVVQLARVTGRPIVPMAFARSHGYRFNSWDRFLVPYPRGKAVYAFGAPLYYEKGESIDSFRDQVQAAMDQNINTAMEHLKHYGLTAL